MYLIGSSSLRTVDLSDHDQWLRKGINMENVCNAKRPDFKVTLSRNTTSDHMRAAYHNGQASA